MRNNPSLSVRLQALGLSKDEVAIFISLLDGQKTQLQISRDTGIARSNVYRIVDDLIDKGLVHETTTDEGKLLEAPHPEALELLVIEQENKAKRQRLTLSKTMQMLAGIQSIEKDFAIKAYRGVAGLKQMLWNELKSEGEIYIFTCGDISAAAGKPWAEKFREETVKRGLKTRWLENPAELALTNSAVESYMDYFKANTRQISANILKIDPEITIHDDTISIYNAWTHDIQLGTEVKNPLLAAFMRQIFEHYWQLAEPKHESRT